MKRQLDPEDLTNLRLRALTAIDGLWFLAVERRYGFDEALRMDLDVWSSYGLIQLKRVSKALGISLNHDSPPELEDIGVLLEAVCSIDGTECESQITNPRTMIFTVHKCPWWDNLKRSGRHEVIPCETIDNSIFAKWLKNVDPSLSFEITKSMPKGAQACEWIVKRVAKQRNK